MSNFKFYSKEHDPDMKSGFSFLHLHELNRYFSHSGMPFTIHDLVLKSHGMHYESRNTLFQVYTKKLELLGYLELLK